MTLRRKNPRYYVDLALFFPMLMCVVCVFVFITDRSSMTVSEFTWWLAGLAGCLLLTKERLVMVGALFGYITIVSAIHIPLTPDTTHQAELLLIALVSGGGLWALIRLTSGRIREAYSEPPSRLDWVICLAALGIVVSALTVVIMKAVDWYAHNWRLFG